MFRLAQPDEIYPTTVQVQVPTKDGWTAHEVTLHFIHLPSDRVLQLVRDSDADFLAAAIIGWDGVEDHDGTALGCTEPNRRRLANVSYFARAAVDAYFARFDPSKNS